MKFGVMYDSHENVKRIRDEVLFAKVMANAHCQVNTVAHRIVNLDRWLEQQ